MNLKKIRDLDIAKKPFDYSKDIEEDLDYSKWTGYIDMYSDYFIWDEDTEDGRLQLNSLDKIPEWAREKVLIGLNKGRCFAEFDKKKNHYLLSVAVHTELKRIRVTFERIPTIDDLKRFLDMANYLDAYLLNNGNEIIDEEFIENYK